MSFSHYAKRSKRKLSRHTITQQQGLSLLEVLISVLILTLGLLGVAALQTQALRTSADAQYFQQATQLANDYLERIRANSNNVGQYAVAQTKPNCTAPNLTGSAAEQDKTLWLQQIACSLPDGTALVVINNQQIRISISWFDRAANANTIARTNQFNLTSQL